jgi:hypothetical protein
MLAVLAAALFMLGLARPAEADAGTGSLHQDAGDYQVHLVYLEPVATGVIPVRVEITNEHGQPVADARVQIVQILVAGLGGHGHAAGGQAHEHNESAGDDHAHETPSSAGSGGAAAGGHDEAIPHAHDDKFLFQLSWSEEAQAYVGSVIFFDTGQWAADIEFSVAGQDHAAQFVVDVFPPDYGRAALAVFSGLNIAILAGAAVLRRRRAAS